jgi:cytochrome c peroxidase
MHAGRRNPPEASPTFAGMRPLAYFIAQNAGLSQWRLRLLLTIGVVGPAILVLGCAPAHTQDHQNALQQEIGQIEHQVDIIESDVLTTIPSLAPGSPERLPRLGKILFFDKELSVNRNEACAFCHMPQTGFQGAIESLNKGAVAQPGSVRTRFSLRKPPSAAYAAFSPPLFYPDKPGEAKCSHCFIGGNIWDLRATGLRLQSPTAMQGAGSSLNPTEMATPDPACVVRRMSERPYRGYSRVSGDLARSMSTGRRTLTLCAADRTAIPPPQSDPRFPDRTQHLS